MSITKTQIHLSDNKIPRMALVLAVLSIASIVYACNEAICASVVSKCMLTQSCKCDITNCSCCRDCFYCLNNLYAECCSCVDMCPKTSLNQTNVSKSSYLEDLADNVPGLFYALTSDTDLQKRWLPVSYPLDLDIALLKSSLESQEYQLQNIRKTEAIARNLADGNCTVAYMSQCMSCDKCRASCRSMGSSSFRWFHDGCCECVGDKCLFYGINESRCLECPKEIASPEEDDLLETTTMPNMDDDLLYDDLDYGEEVDNQSV